MNIVMICLTERCMSNNNNRSTLTECGILLCCSVDSQKSPTYSGNNFLLLLILMLFSYLFILCNCSALIYLFVFFHYLYYYYYYYFLWSASFAWYLTCIHLQPFVLSIYFFSFCFFYLLI